MDITLEPGKDYKVRRGDRRPAIMIHVLRIERQAADLGGDVAWAYRVSPSGSTYGREIPYFVGWFTAAEPVDREALGAAADARYERRQTERLLVTAAGAAWGLLRKVAAEDRERLAEELLSEWAFLGQRRGDKTLKCDFAVRVAALEEAGDAAASRLYRRFVRLATAEGFPL